MTFAPIYIFPHSNDYTIQIYDQTKNTWTTNITLTNEKLAGIMEETYDKFVPYPKTAEPCIHPIPFN